jgi:excisionase family DNA binding protein
MNSRPRNFLDRGLTVSFVAQRLGCSADTVSRLIESGELAGFQLREHGWWRITPASLDAYIERVRKRHALS